MATPIKKTCEGITGCTFTAGATPNACAPTPAACTPTLSGYQKNKVMTALSKVVVVAHNNQMSTLSNDKFTWTPVHGTCAGGEQKIKFYFNVDVILGTPETVAIYSNDDDTCGDYILD